MDSSLFRIELRNDSVEPFAMDHFKPRGIDAPGKVGVPITPALHHEFQLYCGEQALPDLSLVTAPVFLYYGGEDTTVPIDPHAIRWQEAYSSVQVTERFYPGEGHDVQYRHFDQTLVDIAGMSDQVVVCRNGKSRLVSAGGVEKVLAKGGSLGICAWRD